MHTIILPNSRDNTTKGTGYYYIKHVIILPILLLYILITHKIILPGGLLIKFRHGIILPEGLFSIITHTIILPNIDLLFILDG